MGVGGIREAGPPLCSYLDLFLSPLVEVHWFYPGYMYPQIPVDSSTPNADKHANVPGGPSWPYEDGDRAIKYKLWECPSPSVLLRLSSNISAKIKWERLYCNHLYIDFIHSYGSMFDFQLKRFAELCGDHQSNSRTVWSLKPQTY